MGINIFQKILKNKKLDYSTNLYEYLENDLNKKAIIFITTQQYAMISSDAKDFEHSELIGILLNDIYNVKEKNECGCLSDIITIIIGPNDFVINLPNGGKLSQKQLDILEELIYYVIASNRDYLYGKKDKQHEIKIFDNENMKLKYNIQKNNISEFFDELRNYVVEPNSLYLENIIGRDLLTANEKANYISKKI